MDVTLHWQGDWPQYLRPLLSALEGLPEAADAPEGQVSLCPDATCLPPPEGSGALVAAVPDPPALPQPAYGDQATRSLRQWAERGAVFVCCTPTAGQLVRALTGTPSSRVHVVPLPLTPERVPAAARGNGTDVLAVPPVAYPSVLTAMAVLRQAGVESRCVLASGDAAPYARPGGTANRYGLLAGYEVVAAADWRAAAATAAVILLSEGIPGDGRVLREALATGKPVAAASTPLLLDHLAAIGAAAYLYRDSADVSGLVAALRAALRRDRGRGLEAAARAAVVGERWSDAAQGFYQALEAAMRAAAGPPAPLPPPRNASPWRGPRPAVEPAGERLRVTVLNPRSSTGGGERFLRQLVRAMAGHRSAPEVTLVCAVEPDQIFEAGLSELEDAGARVVPALPADFDRVAAETFEASDLVYCAWPHLSDPPVTTLPLVCTFHDVNWRHFDVMGPEFKALAERQSPAWIERCAAIVHSSDFIRREVHEHYLAPPARTHVIPLTAEAPAGGASAAERERIRIRFCLPDRFLLCPAGVHLHKNYPALDAALRRLRARGRPVTVVATGALTDVCYHGPDLIGIGYVSSAELNALYELCAGVVQTTLYEAGSFPMAEAMIAGKPVAISRIPPIVEQVERVGVVAELFDPLDPGEIAEAIAQLWEGSPATTPEAVASNAARVADRSWDDVAGEYLDLFSEVARRTRPLSAVAR